MVENLLSAIANLHAAGVRANLNDNYNPANVLEKADESQLFLCLKEALNNVYRHSKCKNVEVKYSQLENILLIDVIDDGVGLINAEAKGNGLKNMEARMVALDGSFSILPSEKGLHLQMLVDLEEEYLKLSS